MTQTMILYFDMDSVYKEQVEGSDVSPSDDENTTIASVDSIDRLIVDKEAENGARGNARDSNQQQHASIKGTAQHPEPSHQSSSGTQSVGKQTRKRKRVSPERT